MNRAPRFSPHRARSCLLIIPPPFYALIDADAPVLTLLDDVTFAVKQALLDTIAGGPDRIACNRLLLVKGSKWLGISRRITLHSSMLGTGSRSTWKKRVSRMWTA